jgi:hypothetical protein
MGWYTPVRWTPIPRLVGNSIYWGSGYGHFGPSLGTPNNKLFAFSIANDEHD